MVKLTQRADRYTHQRRAQETRLQSLQEHLGTDHKLRHTAHWEAKTDNLIAQSSVRERVRQLYATHQQSVEDRRR